MSNSYEEYLYRETKEFMPVKYELTPCGYYLIGNDALRSSAE